MKYITDLPEELVRRAQSEAANRGISFNEFCTEAIRKEVMAIDPDGSTMIGEEPNSNVREARD